MSCSSRCPQMVGSNLLAKLCHLRARRLAFWLSKLSSTEPLQSSTVRWTPQVRDMVVSLLAWGLEAWKGLLGVRHFLLKCSGLHRAWQVLLKCPRQMLLSEHLSLIQSAQRRGRVGKYYKPMSWGVYLRKEMRREEGSDGALCTCRDCNIPRQRR